ncbi:hypothetical protein BDF19DRAFT_311418 [Syncephalis fuscata]|nr:hypothetical protein BDF19DRAFT_311418 [Syncephalis fuscata]
MVVPTAVEDKQALLNTMRKSTTREGERVSRERVNRFRAQFLQYDAPPPRITAPLTETITRPASPTFDVASVDKLSNSIVTESPTKKRLPSTSSFLPCYILNDEQSIPWPLKSDTIESNNKMALIEEFPPIEDILLGDQLHEWTTTMSQRPSNDISGSNTHINTNPNSTINTIELIEDSMSTIISTEHLSSQEYAQAMIASPSTSNGAVSSAIQERHQYPLRQRKAISLFPYTLNTWTRHDNIPVEHTVDTSILYEPMQDNTEEAANYHELEHNFMPHDSETDTIEHLPSIQSSSNRRPKTRRQPTSGVLMDNSIDEQENIPLMELIARRLVERAQQQQQVTKNLLLNTTITKTNSTSMSPTLSTLSPSPSPSSNVHFSNVITVLSSDEEESTTANSNNRRTKRRILESSESENELFVSDQEEQIAVPIRYKVPRKVTAGDLRGKLPASFIKVNQLDQWHRRSTPAMTSLHSNRITPVNTFNESGSELMPHTSPVLLPMDALDTVHEDVFARDEPLSDPITAHLSISNNNEHDNMSLDESIDLLDDMEQPLDDVSSSDMEDNTFHPGYFPFNSSITRKYTLNTNNKTTRPSSQPKPLNTRLLSHSKQQSNTRPLCKSTVKYPSYQRKNTTSHVSTNRARKTFTSNPVQSRLRSSISVNPFLRNYHQYIVQYKQHNASRRSLSPPQFLTIAHRQLCRPLSTNVTAYYDVPRQKLISIQEPAMKRHAARKRLLFKSAPSSGRSINDNMNQQLSPNVDTTTNHITLNDLPCPTNSNYNRVIRLTIKDAFNYYKNAGDDRDAIAREWQCFNHSISLLSDRTTLLQLIPFQLTCIIDYLRSLLLVSDTQPYSGSNKEETCRQVFDMINLFIRKQFIHPQILPPSLEETASFVSLLEQFFYQLVPLMDTLTDVTIDRPGISLLVETKSATIQWLSLLGMPVLWQSQPIDDHSSPSDVAYQAASLSSQVAVQLLPLLYQLTNTPIIAILKTMYTGDYGILQLKINGLLKRGVSLYDYLDLTISGANLIFYFVVHLVIRKYGIYQSLIGHCYRIVSLLMIVTITSMDYCGCSFRKIGL